MQKCFGCNINVKCIIVRNIYKSVNITFYKKIIKYRYKYRRKSRWCERLKLLIYGWMNGLRIILL